MLKNEEYSWRFAPTHGGAEHSSNAAQHHFAADAYSKMVREILQNSLDHPEPGLGQVEVTFEIIDIPTSAVKGHQLVPHIKSAINEVQDQEELEKYQKATQLLERPTVRALAIRDANTTGLTGTNWKNLIFKEGAPDNRSEITKGGSFGFGKNAPFNLSLCNTIIYSTRYVSNMAKGRVTRAAGRCQLATHDNPNKEERLQHIGFLAIHNHQDETTYNQPIEGPSVPEPFQLTETGTGIFIIAFDDQTFYDWPERTKEATIRNFFAAIQKGNLAVSITSQNLGEQYKIDQGSIGALIADLPPRDETRYYYQALKAEATRTKPSGKLTQFGDIDLWITTDAEACRRLAHINRRGMLITNSRQGSDNPLYPYGGGMWAPWAAVTMATTEEADRYLRRMEPPAHDSIKPNLFKLPNDQANAREELKLQQDQIRHEIRAAIDDLHRNKSDNIRELAELFPGIPIKGDRIETSMRPIQQNTDQKIDADDEEEQNLDALQDDDNGDLLEEGDFQNNEASDNEDEEKEDKEEENDEEETKKDKGKQEQRARPAQGNIRGLRIIKQDPTTLFMTFKTPATEQGILKFGLQVAGEQYQNLEERISIREATEVADLTVACTVEDNNICISAPADTTLNLRIKTNQEDHRHVSYRLATARDAEV